MTWDRVMNAPTNPVALEFGRHCGTVLNADDRKVVHGFGSGMRRDRTTRRRELLTIPLHGAATCEVRVVQVGELDRQHGRLEGVQPAVASALVVTVPVRGGST